MKLTNIQVQALTDEVFALLKQRREEAHEALVQKVLDSENQWVQKWHQYLMDIDPWVASTYVDRVPKSHREIAEDYIESRLTDELPLTFSSNQIERRISLLILECKILGELRSRLYAEFGLMPAIKDSVAQ